MLRIGKTYVVRTDGISRLCADLTIDDRRTMLWFGVDSAQEEWLALGRSDAFVMALLPTAMRGGHEIICEDPMSERLHHQLASGLIPTLAFSGEFYHTIRVIAPLTAEGVPNQGAVGTGYSGGVDCLYTIMRHGADSELPLTHIAVFNTGNIVDRSELSGLFRQAKAFGAEKGLRAFFVDANFGDILPEHYGGVYTFRNLACVLALRGLFSAYLLSSGSAVARFDLNPRICDRYDPLTVACAGTESLSVYLSGVEATRVGKIAALTRWETSRHWLHPCTGELGKTVNCSRCSKCIKDMTILYGLGELENYRAVYDVENYLRHLPERIGIILARRDSDTCRQAVQLLKARQVPIPRTAYIYAKQFQRAMEIAKK